MNHTLNTDPYVLVYGIHQLSSVPITADNFSLIALAFWENLQLAETEEATWMSYEMFFPLKTLVST